MRKFLLSFLATLLVFPALATEQEVTEVLTFNLFSNNTDTQYAAERKYTSSTSGFSY